MATGNFPWKRTLKGGLIGAGAIAGLALWLYNRDASQEPEPEQPTFFTTNEQVYFYNRQQKQLGVLAPNSCVIIKPSFASEGPFKDVEINTGQEIIAGRVSKRLLVSAPGIDSRTCTTQLRQVLASSANDSPALPQAETYSVSAIARLFSTTDGTQLSNIFLKAGSCVSIVLSGSHPVDKFRVTVSGENIVLDALIERSKVKPLGKYNWDTGCNAALGP